MVVDGILSVIFGFVKLLLSPLASVSANFPTTFMTKFMEVIRFALYIMPMGKLMPIVVFFVALMAFRIAVSLIKTIWNLLPFL